MLTSPDTFRDNPLSPNGYITKHVHYRVTGAAHDKPRSQNRYFIQLRQVGLVRRHLLLLLNLEGGTELSNLRSQVGSLEGSRLINP